ncbi:MAG TPA: thiamine pyrophosphate-dependent enzyme [Thermoanaerobaculia bacterium]|jgi:pyruvate dehydrogenase E1 component alpha subunit|nr:thiamine pyrophosphate-dependent enzyme [Thermoanaerobaculia bacterium]
MNVTVTDQLAQRSGLGPAELQDLLRRMIAARLFSSRCFSLQRQGRMGTMAPIDGAEALIVGAAAALDPATDWVLPQYREMHGLLRFGEEVLTTTVKYLRGDPAGGHFPAPIRIWPPQIALAAQIPQAVGLAWGMKLRREEGVVLVFFGDGATSEGDFYEGCNFAGVLDAPVIFLCNNNAWAISTPVRLQTRARSFAAKAEAFGFPGESVDGRDVLAVRDAVARARARAIAGGGPTLIEARSYRLGPHTTADDPGRYVPAAEIERERQRDPIDLFRRELEEAGLWNASFEEETRRDADARFDRALQAAEAATVRPDAFFDHVYDRPTARMERQRRELLEALSRDEIAAGGAGEPGGDRSGRPDRNRPE